MNRVTEEIVFRWFVTVTCLVVGAFTITQVVSCTRELNLAKIEARKLKAKEGHQFRFGITRKQDKQ